MNASADLDRIRGGALERIDAAQRRFKAAFVATALVEAVLLGLVLVFMDFKDHTHVLVFLTSIMVYSVLAAGLVTLGAYVRVLAERVLKAITLLDERGGRAQG
jgi:hypothetical protein